MSYSSYTYHAESHYTKRQFLEVRKTLRGFYCSPTQLISNIKIKWISWPTYSDSPMIIHFVDDNVQIIALKLRELQKLLNVNIEMMICESVKGDTLPFYWKNRRDRRSGWSRSWNAKLLVGYRGGLADWGIILLRLLEGAYREFAFAFLLRDALEAWDWILTFGTGITWPVNSSQHSLQEAAPRIHAKVNEK